MGHHQCGTDDLPSPHTFYLMVGGITDMTSVYFSLFSFSSAHRELWSDPPPQHRQRSEGDLPSSGVRNGEVLCSICPCTFSKLAFITTKGHLNSLCLILSLSTDSKLYRKESGIIGCLLPSLQHLVSTFSLGKSEHKPLWSEK